MTTLRSRSPLIPCLLWALALAACGGGASGASLPASGSTALTITTAHLPGGSVGSTFVPTSLEAINQQGPLLWRLESGSLPPGLALDSSGVLAGTPSQSGDFAFVVGVSDEVASAVQALSIAVGRIGLSATEGLFLGDAWSEKPVTLRASGATGSVVFGIQLNDSGGSLSSQDPQAGTAVWTPGPNGSAHSEDVLRASDQGNGLSATLTLNVLPNPAAQHRAAFGSSDVWWIDATVKRGSHAYASDLHQALASVGLRAAGSTDATGSAADQWALLYFRVEVLRFLNPMFLRNADGSPGAQGLAISFPFKEPGAGYAKPANGNWLSGSPLRYSQLGLVHGSSNGVIGTAFLDSSTNGLHENDTTDTTLELGVFANQMVALFNSAYNNTLVKSPVGPADVPALRALVYELPGAGGRSNLLGRIGRGFARTVAATVAHEVGHSLGLSHTNPSQPGSIMNPAALIGPSASYAFTNTDLSTLQAALPGAGKTTAGQVLLGKAGDPASQDGVPKEGVPAGGVVVCGAKKATGRNR